MKNLILKVKDMQFLMTKAMIKAKGKLEEKKGSFFTEHALVIAVTVAVAGLVLTLMFALFKDTIVPSLTSKISEFFDYKNS